MSWHASFTCQKYSKQTKLSCRCHDSSHVNTKKSSLCFEASRYLTLIYRVFLFCSPNQQRRKKNIVTCIAGMIIWSENLGSRCKKRTWNRTWNGVFRVWRVRLFSWRNSCWRSASNLLFPLLFSFRTFYTNNLLCRFSIKNLPTFVKIKCLFLINL